MEVRSMGWGTVRGPCLGQKGLVRGCISGFCRSRHKRPEVGVLGRQSPLPSQSGGPRWPLKRVPGL